MNQENRHLDVPILTNLFKNRAITERCAQILGPDLLLWHSAFFNILPFSSGTPWHQTSTWLSVDMKDSSLYPPDVEDLFQLTCWIAITDAPKEKSCMKVISGSQREIYPVKHNKSQLDKGGRAFGNYAVDIDYPVDEKNVKLLEAKAGQCIIFCERMLHSSTDNVTDKSRWAMVGRIVRPDTRIFTKKILQEGWGIEVFGIKKVKLDYWNAVLLRGKDRFGYNKVLKETSDSYATSG